MVRTCFGPGAGSRCVGVLGTPVVVDPNVNPPRGVCPTVGNSNTESTNTVQMTMFRKGLLHGEVLDVGH